MDAPAPRLPKTALAMLLVAAGAAMPYLVPELARFRPIRPDRVAALAASVLGERPTVPLLVAVRREPPPPQPGPAPEAGPADAPVPGPTPGPGAPRPQRPRPSRSPETAGAAMPVEDPTGQLERFFRKLARTEAGEDGAVTRVSHFGDSPLTGDLISGDARASLQAAFGNAGHGFVLAGRPWAWYGHRGVSLKASGWRVLSSLVGTGNGGHTGLSGVGFGSRGGASTEVALEKDTFSRVTVSFTRQPGGGHLLVSVDGGPPEAVATAGAARETGSFSKDLPEGASRLSLRPKGDGDVTVHGVVLENEGPGLVYDALGANGASVHFLSLIDGASWEQALAARGSDLVILNYGTNESGYWGIPGPRYTHDYTEVIGRVRRALPDASILLMAPMDRGTRGESGDIVTMPTIPRIVEAQRQVARESGVAFFDTFAAMGGEGTMARWYDSEPRLVTGDFTHTTHAGSARVARLLVSALEDAFGRWKAGQARREPPPPEPVVPARVAEKP